MENITNHSKINHQQVVVNSKNQFHNPQVIYSDQDMSAIHFQYASQQNKYDKENIHSMGREDLNLKQQISIHANHSKVKQNFHEEIRVRSIDSNEEKRNPHQMIQNTKSMSKQSQKVAQPLSSSPKPIFHEHMIKFYEYNNQQKQQFPQKTIEQLGNDRNSQPPLQYNSLNSDKERNLLSKKNSISNNTKKTKAKNFSSHKKSQSLYNKKIVDIIQGLQSSLGVIAKNVKNSFNSEEMNQIIGNVKGKSSSQKKTLIESALLAQQLAKMTSAITNQIKKNDKSQDDNKKISKRKNSKQSIISIDHASDYCMKNSNRASLDFQQIPKTKYGFHYRKKSDLQNCRKQTSICEPSISYHTKKNTLLTYSGKTIDNNQGQGGIIIGSNSIIDKQITQNKEQNQLTLNTQHIQKGSSQNNQKEKDILLYKLGCSGSTIDNTKSKITQKKKATSGDRLSDSNFIVKLNKKTNNFLLGNSNNQYIESKLKSAASSPTLHSHTRYKEPQHYNMKKQTIFDFGQQSIKMINAKNKASLKQNKPDKDILKQHKHSVSNVSQLNDFFHLQQQMISNNKKDKKFLIKGIPTPSNINYIMSNTKPNQQHQKAQIISNLSSKRPSNEEDINLLSYNSPKQISKMTANPNDMYSQMKNFLKKIQLKDQPVEQVKQQEFIINNITRTIGSNTTGESTCGQSFGSQKVTNFNKNLQSKQKQSLFSQQQQTLENLDFKRLSQYQQDLKKQLQHKRTKSDATQQFIIKQSQQNEKKKPQVADKMFYINNQDQKQSKQIQQIAQSERQSLGKSNLIYYNFDDTQSNQKTQQLTNRSERQIQSKVQQAISNQTTMKKPLKGSTQIQETHQFNFLKDTQPLPKPKLIYNDLEIDCLDDKNYSQKYYLNDKEENFNDVKNEERVFFKIPQSPKLNILPTPKAVQPGINFDGQQSVSEIQYGQTNNGVLINTLDSNDCQFQTFESNITCNDNLSPRTKDKKRLIKQIRLSFYKLKEPIKTTSEFYRIGKMLGKGAFGRVNLAIHKLCEQLVAVKSINKQFLTDDVTNKQKVMQEVLILQKTRHKNIVKLFDSFETNKHIVFVMELCAGGDLLNYVRKRRKLKEDIAKYIFKQVVEGLYYCHAKNIVHRDIKLDNLLLDDEGTVKICDFGVSKLIKDQNEILTEQCGTPAYIAPEILKDKGYKGFGVDIWSLGVCLYAMLYGTVPFKANNMSELHQLILKAKYSLKDDKVEITEDAKNLIKALLEPDPLKRLTIEQVEQHPWLHEAYQENAFLGIEIFSEAEKQTIKKDFTYQDMSRFKRNKQNKQQLSTEHLFTEHALDSTQNALLKNCSTKSIILAPFNSTISHKGSLQQDEEGNSILPPLEFDESMLVNKKVIKYAARVKDINRQYEINNNCELDNGVYNKFVRQSTSNSKKSSKEGQYNILSQENSIMTSMNKQQKIEEGQNAPQVTQNSEEEIEALLIRKNQMQGQSELRKIQSQLQLQTTLLQIKEEQLIINNDVLIRVERFGYPKKFIIDSLNNYEMNDAATSYFLLDKDIQHIITEYTQMFD